MVISPEEGVLEQARDTDNNIIISNSKLCIILPPQLNNISMCYKVMCGCERFISSKIMHYYLLRRRDSHLKQPKDKIHNAQNIRSGKIERRMFKTYRNYVRPHSCNIQNTSADMYMSTIYPCNYINHRLLHCKYVFLCCDK